MGAGGRNPPASWGDTGPLPATIPSGEGYDTPPPILGEGHGWGPEAESWFWGIAWGGGQERNPNLGGGAGVGASDRKQEKDWAMARQEKSTPRIRGTTPEVDAAARRGRRDMTPAEKALWAALRGKKLGGLKFRRQHPLGPFILDFYCPARKLVVELDGAGHAEQGQKSYDAARTERLNDYGCRVIRFRNEEVLHDLPSVLARILEAGEGPP